MKGSNKPALTLVGNDNFLSKSLPDSGPVLDELRDSRAGARGFVPARAGGRGV
jgi:hypothetical protein